MAVAMRRLWSLTLGDQRGSAFITGIFAVWLLAILGIAAFDLTTIEARLVAKTAAEAQAFYCADAQVARIYKLYKPENDPTGTLGSKTANAPGFSGSNIRLGAITDPREYSFSATAAVNAATGLVTVTATCTQPDGSTRTVQRNGTRTFLSNSYDYAAVLGGFNSGGVQQYLGNFFLGGRNCTGSNCVDGVYHAGSNNNYIGGADSVNGDIYVSGTVYLRDGTTLTGYSSTDSRATITTNPGACDPPPCIQTGNSTFNPNASGAAGSSPLNPMPCLVSPCADPKQTPVIDDIAAAVAGKMKATYAGTTVYNLAEIFNQLGTDGSSGANLRQPTSPPCTFGQPSADPKCQIWQDLAIIGPRKACDPTCPSGVQGPHDKPSYYFMGIAGTPSGSSVWSAAVTASAELRQMGFDGSAGNCIPNGSICKRLTALFGSNLDNEGNNPSNIVDLTVGTDPTSGASTLRAGPPIFYVDGYWRADVGSPGIVYNGRGTVVASKSMMISDNVLYLNSAGVDGSPGNVNLTLPPSCSNNNDRTNCGMGDMLALVAKEDIWIGDASSAAERMVHEVSALMLAGRDFNYVDYTSSGSCCQGPSNPVTLNGTAMASRQVAMVRDWAWPQSDQTGKDRECNNAASGCLPVAFFPTLAMAQAAGFTGGSNVWCANPSYSSAIPGCWVFMTLDTTTGVLKVDNTVRAALGNKAAFNEGCVTVGYGASGNPQFWNQAGKALLTGSCPTDSRRVTHFQLKINYDTRLKTTPGLIPLGLPTGGENIYNGLTSATWKDCGSKPACT